MNALSNTFGSVLRYLSWSTALSVLFCSIAVAQEAPAYTFTGPYTHDNLNMYLIHGKDEVDATKLLTLGEALAQKQAIVHETGSVQELSVENISKEKAIFIQAGDIVKGGQQDRVMSQNMVLKPNSGKTAISSFCVEQGRWQKRGSEAVTAFTSSNNRLASKQLKLAAMSEKKQTEVWQQVAEVQKKLSKNAGSPVQDRASASSLQLSLESKPVEKSTKAYKAAFEKLLGENKDAIGYVFAINGELNAAEIYGAHEILHRVWDKSIEAAATEALAEKGQSFTAKEFAQSDLAEFIAAADSAPQSEEPAVGTGKTFRREDTKNMFIGTRLGSSDGWVHKQYLKK